MSFLYFTFSRKDPSKLLEQTEKSNADKQAKSKSNFRCFVNLSKMPLVNIWQLLKPAFNYVHVNASGH